MSSGAKAVVDATNYKDMYYRMIINNMPFLIFWISFVVSGLAMLKFKHYARMLIIITSLVGFLITFVIPALQLLFNKRALTISFDSVIVLFILNIWFFSKKATKEQLKNLDNPRRCT